ncbi:histidine triad nucleotide-binding protein [Acanthopleuribacter pedis]|uniref:Histidine triad nucleotide-binding protein n=1 Tax=Acanthopleuribacter pedis TaxID=442870 RepID=A0A8J7QJ27_9BACT|nr:histidine triad nucleotide-binding protein [Acanthopleuribacter pedis]MBO1319135.1 histidine triad nucleotide-binding protein [Acanthopleuribacter pedis]
MTLFQKIIDREIPADFVYEDDDVCAFRDIAPQAPTHILVIPKKPLVKIAEMGEEDTLLIGKLMLCATQIAKEQGIEDYRLVINNGAKAGQSVFHLHLHILAGRPFTWPPG